MIAECEGADARRIEDVGAMVERLLVALNTKGFLSDADVVNIVDGEPLKEKGP